MADPRNVRIQRILCSNVLDMKVERATFLNIPPSSKYDLYLNEIRSVDSKIKQMGVPTDLEIREVDVNTDEITSCDKELQFCHGDDTNFLNVLKTIRKKKSRDSELKSIEASEDRNLSVATHDRSDGNSSRLSEFLRKSSMAIENLLSETNRTTLPAKSIERDHKMLIEKFPWKDAGRDGKNGGNELLRSRPAAYVKFSELNADVFLTIHPFPESDSEDLRPFKVIRFLTLDYFFRLLISCNITW